MTGMTIVLSAVLVVGLVQVAIACANWRQGGKRGAIVGTILAANAVSALGTGWVRYAAWAVLAPILIVEGKRYFTERDPGALWIGLFFLPFILGIALTEVFYDNLSVLQRAAFAAFAVLVAAAIATAIVRLVQGRRNAHHA